ncbi:MAG: Ig-like domain-containing protein [Eubacteriales bacterium]
MCPNISFADSGTITQGDGTESDPYGVSTPEQLNAVRYYPDAYFIMLDDIDMSEATSEGGVYWNDGEGWDPIDFSGTFDGNTYSITGLYIKTDISLKNNGLFGEISASAVVKNLNMLDCSISARDYAGAIAGKNKGTISNCNTTGTITARMYNVGGVTGFNMGTVSDCVNDAVIVTNSDGGGIAGQNYGTIRSCANINSIFGEVNFGGIVGGNYGGTVDMCYNTGSIIGTDTYSTRAGGIVGYLYPGIISSCFNTGEVFAVIHSGGIAGYCNRDFDDSITCTINHCYNIGEITADEHFGGIAGGVWRCTFDECYYADISSTGIGDGTAIGTMSSKTLNEMKYQSTYSGFYFEDVWEIVEGERYPVLQEVPFIYVTGISLDGTLALQVGESETLLSAITPSDASNKNVSWASSDDSIATVADGTVSGVSSGTVTITVTTGDGGFTDTCTVTVKSSQIKSLVYTIDTENSLLRDVSINTSVTELKTNLDNDAADIKVYDKDGNEYTGDTVASGMVVKLIVNDTVKDQLTLAIRGDVSGNGQIDIADYILIRSFLYGLINLNTLQFFSADVNNSGNIDIADYILVRSHMYGLIQL